MAIQTSVVVATYNGAEFLEQQLNSILHQTVLPDEIIICDDCSSDDTPFIIKKFEKYSFIKIICSEKNIGVIENFKKGVSLCAANNYIFLSDQDDIWMPKKMELEIEKMREIENDNKIPTLIYSDLLLINEHEKVLNNSFWNEIGADEYVHNLKTLLFGNIVLGCTTFFNPAMRSYFNTIPSNLKLKHDAWIGLVAHSIGKYFEIKEPLVKYRKHTNNVTSISTYIKPNRLLKIKNHLIYLLNDKGFLESQLELAIAFLNQYNHQIPEASKKCITNFIGLQTKNYIQKKILQRKYFKSYWI